MLALGHRCQHPAYEPKLSRPLRRCRREYDLTATARRPAQEPISAQIDPNRTISAGRIDIGAFRTYPADYTPPNAASSEYQSIPLAKIEDFGAHANSYYALEIEHFKSSLDSQILDLLWNKYWVMTLSQSPLISVGSSLRQCQ